MYQVRLSIALIAEQEWTVNDMRLIDADALLADIQQKAERGFPANKHMSIYAESCVVHAPTVDAVEVVRCKDCKHKGWIQEPCHGKSVPFCHVLDLCINNPNKCYCSYGERKDGGGSADNNGNG